jgi:TIGR03009 family protein
MRRAGLVLSALLATTPAIIAQGPPTAPPNGTPMGLANTAQLPGGARGPVAAIPVANATIAPALQAHLNAWESKNKATISLWTECEYVIKQPLFKKESSYTGVVMCMKPNLALMRIDNKIDKTDFKSYISDGQTVHEYIGRDKTINQYRVPPGGKGGVGDNLLMEFMSGMMTAEDVKQRFDIKLDKEDANYVHLRITPRIEKDRKEFDTMLLVLYGPKLADRKWDYLPAVCMMTKNGGEEVETWTFKNPQLNNEGVKKEQFVATIPKREEGWTINQNPGGTQGTPKANTPTVPKR